MVFSNRESQYIRHTQATRTSSQHLSCRHDCLNRGNPGWRDCAHGDTANKARWRAGESLDTTGAHNLAKQNTSRRLQAISRWFPWRCLACSPMSAAISIPPAKPIRALRPIRKRHLPSYPSLAKIRCIRFVRRTGLSPRQGMAIQCNFEASAITIVALAGLKNGKAAMIESIGRGIHRSLRHGKPCPLPLNSAACAPR